MKCKGVEWKKNMKWNEVEWSRDNRFHFIPLTWDGTLTGKNLLSVFQIRRSNRDNLRIIIHMFPSKHIL